MSYNLHDYLDDMEQEGYLAHRDAPELERAVEWKKGVRRSEIVVEGKSKVWADAGLAGVLEDINAAGYQSAQSCSGLQRDHERKKTTTGGYISWFASDLNEQQIKRIEAAANRAGLEFKHSDLFFLPAVSVRADKLADGSIEAGLKRQATQVTNQAWGISERPSEIKEFMVWLKQRNELVRREAEAHGGLALKTDEAVEAAWECFREALLRASSGTALSAVPMIIIGREM